MEPGDRPATSVTPSTPPPSLPPATLITPWRARLLAWSLALVALAFAQAPGRTVPDTKLDLVVAPGEFLLRALDLWDPAGAFGQVQNQAYGYLFPMGPFFLLGSVLELPPWVVQRLWWSLVLVVAFLGVVKLLGALDIGSPWARILAGLAFALSPRMLTVLGPTSIEMWPSAMAPWVLVPLVLAVRRTGADPRRGAALSAVAVACVGGVNAAATFAVVPMAAWWMWTAPAGPRRRSLLMWWPPLVLLGTLWWLLPLFLLGRVSPPFLDYIESISNTSFAATSADALRGTTNWVAYVDPGSPAGGALLTDPVVILNGAVVVALGVLGLAMSDLPYRRFLVPSLLVGLALVTAGHVGATSGWQVDTVRDLLDGALSPLRNTHKFDVLVRLPLVIGLCHVVTRLGGDPDGTAAGDRARSLGVRVLVVAALVGATSPAWTGQLAPRGSFDEIPDHWVDTASWLEDNSRGTTLVTPAATFARYSWGRTNDEPLQALMRQPWAVRNVIPLAPGANIEMLDTVSSTLASGEGSPAFRDALRRSGIGTIVLRHDLDRGQLDTASPETVRATLLSTPGIRLAARFGPEVGGGPTLVNDEGRRIFVDAGRQSPRPAVEIFEVAGIASQRSVEDAAEVEVLVGDAGSQLRLDELASSGGASSIMGPDVEGSRPSAPWTLTDGNRRREVAFGAVHRNRSGSLTESEPFRADRRVHRYDQARIEPWSTVPVLDGAAGIGASSSQSDVGARPRLDPSAGPWAAFDDDPSTAWRPNLLQGPEAWLELDLGRRIDIGTLAIVLDLPQGETRELTVATEDGPRRVTAQGDLPVTLPVGSVDRVRIEGRRSAERELAIRDVSADGLDISRPLRLPTVPETWPAPARILVQAAGGENHGCLELDGTRRCSDTFVERSEDGLRLDRLVPVPSTAAYEPTMRVTARAGQGLDELLQRGRVASVEASSQHTRSPLAGPLAAVDGSRSTAWAAAPDDPSPTLTVRWLDEREIDEISMVTAADLPVSPPTAVRLRFSDGTSIDEVPVTNGRVEFEPVTTDSVEIELSTSRPRVSIDFATDLTTLPVGLGEVAIDGVGGFARFDEDRPVVLECGDGPRLVVGGRTMDFTVETTVSALATGRPLPAQPCATEAMLVTAPETRVLTEGTDAVTPSDVLLARPARSADTSVIVRTGSNANDGWRATESSRAEPVVLDGWQRGWRLADEGAAESLEEYFAPQGPYRTSMVLGVLAFVILLMVAFLPSRQGASPPAAHRGDHRAGQFLALTAVVVSLAVAGVLAAIALVVGGLIAFVAARRRPGADAVMAATAAGAALSMYAISPWGGFDPWAGSSVVPQLLVWAALGAVAAAGVPVGSAGRPSRWKGRSTTR